MSTKTATRPRIASAVAAAKITATARAKAAASAPPTDPPAVPTLTVKELTPLVLQLESAKEQAKALYAQADEITMRLVAAIGDGDGLRLADGRTARVVNNFIDKFGRPKNVAFKPCGVRMFEVEVK